MIRDDDLIEDTLEIKYIRDDNDMSLYKHNYDTDLPVPVYLTLDCAIGKMYFDSSNLKYDLHNIFDRDGSVLKWRLEPIYSSQANKLMGACEDNANTILNGYSVIKARDEYGFYGIDAFDFDAQQAIERITNLVEVWPVEYCAEIQTVAAENYIAENTIDEEAYFDICGEIITDFTPAEELLVMADTIKADIEKQKMICIGDIAEELFKARREIVHRYLHYEPKTEEDKPIIRCTFGGGK